MGSRLILLLLVLFSRGSFGQTTSLERPLTFTAHGRVVQDPSGQPLRKVEVRFAHRGEPNREDHTTTTDAEGVFEIEDLKPGRYLVTVQRAGFVPVGKHSGHGTSIVLASPADAKDVVLHMQAAATLAGKIVDTDGDPLPNASVEAIHPEPGSSRLGPQGFASTNDLGEFRIANLPPGKYLVRVTASGHPRTSKPVDPGKDPSHGEFTYVPTYYPGTLDRNQAVALELHSGDESPVTLIPQAGPTFSIRGTVARPPGAGLLEMMLMPQDGQPSQQTSSIGADGSFENRNLLPGTYKAYLMVIDVTALSELQQGRQPQMQIMPLGRPLEITNANLEDVHLVPEAPAHVRGKIRLDKGQKINWTQLGVMLLPRDLSGVQAVVDSIPGGMAVAQVKADGSFDMPNVVAGEYHLAITSNASGLEDYFTKAVNLDGKDVADSGFTVSGGSYSLEVVVGSQGGTIEGTVVDTKGKPVDEATVLGAPAGERRRRFDVYGRATTDAQGHFRLRGLVPGDYTVFAWEDTDENLQDPEILKAYEGRGEKVQVEEAASKTVTLKVISADGGP